MTPACVLAAPAVGRPMLASGWRGTSGVLAALAGALKVLPGPAGRARRRARPCAGATPCAACTSTLLCIGFVLSLVAGRLVQLQAMEGSRYRALAERQRLHYIPEPAVRGSHQHRGRHHRWP